MGHSSKTTSTNQAAPFLFLAILALIISAHAGCVGGGGDIGDYDGYYQDG